MKRMCIAIALFGVLPSCSQYIPPQKPQVEAPASAPVRVIDEQRNGVPVKIAVVGSQPVAIITPPPAPEPVVEHDVIDKSCFSFHPVYLTQAEVKLLSQTSLTAIVSNNKEGEIRCGWKEHAPPPGG
jgi:hypothetical protein